MKISCSATRLFLILALIAGSIPKVVAADDGQQKPVRLYATAAFGPIGAFQSLDAAAINGRAARGRQLIWGGELIYAPANKSLRVSFDSIGEVALASGTAARFAATTGPDETGRRVLIASLVSGNLEVKLQDEAGAFVQAGGSAFTASRGASFSVGLNEGSPALKIFAGAVETQAQPTQRRYVLRPVGLGSNISVRARSTRQLQIQVTDENDRPVPDLPIIFLVGTGGPGGSTLGSGATAGTSVTATTNSQGIATTSYTAGPNAGSENVTAQVEGTRNSFTWQISILARTGFWNTQNTLLVVAAAATAAGLGIYFATRNNGNEPIRPVPPPQVRPQ